MIDKQNTTNLDNVLSLICLQYFLGYISSSTSQEKNYNVKYTAFHSYPRKAGSIPKHGDFDRFSALQISLYYNKSVK